MFAGWGGEWGNRLKIYGQDAGRLIDTILMSRLISWSSIRGNASFSKLMAPNITALPARTAELHGEETMLAIAIDRGRGKGAVKSGN